MNPAASGEFKKTVDAGGLEKFPIEITAPNVFKRTNAKLELAVLNSDGSLLKEDFLKLQFFPKRVQPNFKDASVALYDPKGNTAELLEKAGLAYKKIKKFDELGDSKIAYSKVRMR